MKPAIEINGGRHQRYINLARKIAENSKFPNYRMSAVVVRGGRVIATSVNKLQPGVLKNPMYEKKACHAELLAMTGIERSKLQGAIVYVAGVSKGNNTLKSAPCPLCEALLRECGIRAAIYHEVDGSLKMLRIA